MTFRHCRSCRKIAYPTKADARKAAERMTKRRGGGAEPYKARCGWWHIKRSWRTRR